jgi:hypothetical protein
LPINGNAVHWHPGVRLAAVSATRARLTFFDALGGAGEATARRWQAVATAAPACKRTSSAIRQASSAGLVDHAALTLEALWFLNAAHLAIRLAALIVARARFALGKAFIGWYAMRKTVWLRNTLIRAAVGIVDTSVARGSATRGRCAAIHPT